MDRVIYAVTGTHASGKDALAHFLANKYNFLHVSSGDLVREEAMKRRGSTDRPILAEVANEVRKTEGASYFADIAIKKFNNDHQHVGLVVSGLRSLGEIKAIRAVGGKVVFVDAPIKIRFERAQKRSRDDEKVIEFSEFEKREKHELSSGTDDSDFNITAIKNSADILIINDSDLDTFIKKSKDSLKLNKEEL